MDVAVKRWVAIVIGLLLVIGVAAGMFVGRLPSATANQLASTRFQLPMFYTPGPGGGDSALVWTSEEEPPTRLCGPFETATKVWGVGGRLDSPAMILDVCATPAPGLAAYLDVTHSALDVASTQRLRFMYTAQPVAAAEFNDLHADSAEIDCVLQVGKACGLWVFTARYGQYWIGLQFHDIGGGGTLPQRAFIQTVRAFDAAFMQALGR